MSRWIRGRGHAGVACLLLLVGITSGCSRWQVATAPAAEVVANSHPEKVRITAKAGGSVVLEAPRVERDSLHGQIPGSATPGTPLQERSLALTDVATLETREPSLTHTLGLVVALPLWLGAGVMLVGF